MPSFARNVSLKLAVCLLRWLGIKAKTQRDPVFGFDVMTECPNVPAEILIPRNVWTDKAAFDAMAKKLAGLFIKNFAPYEGA
jgi:phosphoenolpyruvate carboxykinase (ATP)